MDLPDALRPVSQIVRPVCLRRVLRSARVRPEACHVILVAIVWEVYIAGGREEECAR